MQMLGRTVSGARQSWPIEEREVAMKLVCTLLFLGFAMMTYAQSQTPDQSNEQSSPPQKTTVQVQTPQTKMPPHPPARPVRTPFFRWELSGGYAHITGNQGLDGFNAGASFFLDPKISVGFNYDSGWDTSTLGAFALTNVGLTVSNSHLQNFLAGPRFYFPGLLKGHGNIHGHILHPFVQAQFGESTLYSKLSSVNFGVVTSSDTQFTWVLGGGGDFFFKDHWTARVSADLVRTHFVDEGQSRLRVILGVACRF
jgi:hypothetical protein